MVPLPASGGGHGCADHVDHLFSLRGWALWWRDRELWSWIARGPVSNCYWRVFETNPEEVPGCGRQTWKGAREATRQLYEEREELKGRKLG